MNPRIKELERQAWDYAYDHETVKGNVANGGFINKNFSDEFTKKFAKLIVRECYETIKKDMELAHIQLIPVDFGIYANGRLRRIIKEHFGVE